MNQILTDKEIKAIGEGNIGTWQTDLQFARAIEQAILNKLSEQKPLGWQGHSGHLVYDKKSLLPSTRHLAKPIYLHPAPSVPEGYQLVPIEPTDLATELNAQHAFNAKYFKSEYEKVSQQLSAAQASEAELLKALVAIAEADNASTWTAVCMRHAAKDALDINKARNDGK